MNPITKHYRSALRKRPHIIICTILLFLTYLLTSKIWHTIFSHNYDLNISELYTKQFSVYLMTKDCGRYSKDIVSKFDEVIIVNDIDSPECKALGRGQQNLNFDLIHDNGVPTQDDKYRFKWALALQHCRKVTKAKCLFLEDDVILLHGKEKTKEVLVSNTLQLWFHESMTYDCNRRGWGWITTSAQGLGTQCRIFSWNQADCLSKCWMDNNAVLDTLMSPCQKMCGFDLGRFLLVQNGYLDSAFTDRG